MNRFYHVRAPLMVRQYIGNHEVVPAIIPELSNQNGGCTINIQDHDADHVSVRVAWCRYNDNYSRKLGRVVINGGKITKKVKDYKTGEYVEKVVHDYPGKEPTLVHRDVLLDELQGIEEQMLVSCCYPLRQDPALLKDCMGDWTRAAARFAKEKTDASGEANQG